MTLPGLRFTVLGGRGFVGAALVAHLREEGAAGPGG